MKKRESFTLPQEKLKPKKIHARLFIVTIYNPHWDSIHAYLLKAKSFTQANMLWDAHIQRQKKKKPHYLSYNSDQTDTLIFRWKNFTRGRLAIDMNGKEIMRII